MGWCEFISVDRVVLLTFQPTFSPASKREAGAVFVERAGTATPVVVGS